MTQKLFSIKETAEKYYTLAFTKSFKCTIHLITHFATHLSKNGSHNTGLFTQKKKKDFGGCIKAVITPHTQKSIVNLNILRIYTI